MWVASKVDSSMTVPQVDAHDVGRCLGCFIHHDAPDGRPRCGLLLCLSLQSQRTRWTPMIWTHAWVDSSVTEGVAFFVKFLK